MDASIKYSAIYRCKSLGLCTLGDSMSVHLDL